MLPFCCGLLSASRILDILGRISSEEVQHFNFVKFTYFFFLKSHWINMWLDLWVGPLTCASHGCDSVT